jgi:predicted homoserine dehydrogenase-like protein
VQIYDDLQAYARERGIIRVGLVGAGFMGRGIVEVLEQTPGIEVAAIADVNVEAAFRCFEEVGVSAVREITRVDERVKTGPSSKRVVCSDHRIVTGLEGIDMVIEATGIPEVGAQTAYEAIMGGKHVGMLNVETDVTVGHYLASLAAERGLVYTVCAGDEPAALKELCDFARVCGFTIVAAGKGKNNPLDREATPDNLSARAESLGLNPSMLTEFVDGSKTMVEMACVANGVGLAVDQRNMHGPEAHVGELVEIFRLRDQGGILAPEGVVDYTIGDLAPGVFVVVTHEGVIANQTLRYLKVGAGPHYLLHRPYHLTNLEVPDSVGWAVLHGKATLAANRPPVTEVITVAKRDLRRGDIIDRLGGHTVYGGIENATEARRERLLPLGLAVGATVREEVEKGAALTYEQVELRPSSLLEYRKAQDSMYGKNR